jgi:predicted nucleic acid-binding protein
MCIIVDPPLFVPFFKSSDPDHAIYAPVREWIENGRGKLVIGGTSYKKELMRVASILRLITELEKRGKVVRVEDSVADIEEAAAKKIEPRNDFDDPHLVGLVRATRCRLICVRDPRSHRFLRSTVFYEGTKNRPSLYTRPKNRDLLCERNIAACCR